MMFSVSHFSHSLSSSNLVLVPTANMEEVGFMTYTAANHQGAIEIESFGL